MNQSDFINALAPAAKESMKKTGIPCSFVIAEGALESSWGKSGLAVQGMNLFGVKADRSWKGDIIEMKTREFINNQWIIVMAKWRKYHTWQECIDDHAQFFIVNKRYKNCFNYKDGEGFAKAVAAAGYATDVDYASKLISIIRQYHLSDFDA